MTVTGDGRRHVSLGRGYTLYEFPEQNPKIEEYITTVHERRHNVCCNYTQADATQNYKSQKNYFYKFI